MSLVDEPGRLPQRLESSPSDEGRFVRPKRKSSFVLQAQAEDDHYSDSVTDPIGMAIIDAG
jgi:hypothetical protein